MSSHVGTHPGTFSTPVPSCIALVSIVDPRKDRLGKFEDMGLEIRRGTKGPKVMSGEESFG